MNNFENKIIQQDMKLLLERKIDYWKLNNKTIFITGGTGLLASYIVYFLIYLNENIDNYKCNIILSVRTEEKAVQRFENYLEKEYIECFYGDINREIKIDKKIDYIIHAASIADTKLFSTNPVDVIIPNVVGTYNLLNLAQKNNIESFLFFSSCSAYGKVENSVEIKEFDVGKLDPIDVNSSYSESKRCGESICRAYWLQYNIPVKMVRISHTYGPTIDLENDNRVFAEFIKNIINKENIKMKSSGEAVRSFCYIVDATDAFFKILLNGSNGEVYNMSNVNANISIKDLAYLLAKNYNTNVEFTKRDSLYVENKFSNIAVFNTEKLEKINWQAKIMVEEGFERTIESFEENCI